MSSIIKRLRGSEPTTTTTTPGNETPLDRGQAPQHRDRLPPGQVWAKRYVIYAANGVQKIRPEDWKLRVTGMVESPLEFDYEEVQKLPMKSYVRSFHCLLPDSIVYANPEPLRIVDVKIGTRIIGLDGMRHRVRHLISKQHNGNIIGIKARYLPAALMTPEHPVWTVDGHAGCGKTKSKQRLRTFDHGVHAHWKRADAVKEGDYVFFPRYRYVSSAKFARFGKHDIPLDERLAELLGWYIAEGSGADSCFRSIAFSLNAKQIQEGDRIRQLMREIFDSRTHTYTNERGTLLKIVATTSKFGKLAAGFKTWCGSDAESKKIPEFIINARETVLKSFMMSYLRGDGCSPVFKGKAGVGKDFLDLTTASTTLAYQLLLAFSKLGIAAEMVGHRGSVRDGYSVRMRGKEIKYLIPDFPVVERVDRSRYERVPEGFYFSVSKTWSERYTGPVFDFQAPGFTMLSPFATQDCVTKWSIENPSWEGVPIKYLADGAKVKPEASWVMFHCYDGYTAPVPREDALDEDAIVALRMNGKQLLPEQGFPARPFMPQLYGWKSAKWLGEIEFIPEYRDGYWEMYGYHERANVWAEERFKGDGDYKPVARRAFGTV